MSVDLLEDGIFTDEQVKLLETRLGFTEVKTREAFGKQEVPYVPANKAISQMNRIFGFGNWSLSYVQVPTHIEIGNKHAFQCVVELTVRKPKKLPTDPDVYVSRQGVGAEDFDPNGKKGLEMTIKGVATDAVKRAAFTFGDAFGLYLYDEDGRKDVMAGKSKPQPAAQAWYDNTANIKALADNWRKAMADKDGKAADNFYGRYKSIPTGHNAIAKLSVVLTEYQAFAGK